MGKDSAARIELLKQKEPLPSIEYIYSKLTYFPEGHNLSWITEINELFHDI